MGSVIGHVSEFISEERTMKTVSLMTGFARYPVLIIGNLRASVTKSNNSFIDVQEKTQSSNCRYSKLTSPQGIGVILEEMAPSLLLMPTDTVVLLSGESYL